MSAILFYTFGVELNAIPYSTFLFSHHPSALKCIDIVESNSSLVETLFLERKEFFPLIYQFLVFTMVT